MDGPENGQPLRMPSHIWQLLKPSNQSSVCPLLSTGFMTGRRQLMPSSLFAYATRFCSDGRGTCDRTEGRTRIIRVFKPVESPITTYSQLGREHFTLGATADTAVSGTPTIGWSIPLRLTTIKKTNTAARNLYIEMVVTKIPSRVGHLDHERLAGHGSAGKFQFVTSATIITFCFAF